MSSFSAAFVLDALRRGPLREPAHAWLYEVRNGTGAIAHERYADALVLSVWPSRGLWLAGVEVKVSRSDWLRELDAPQKSAAIQQYTDYWWVAAPEGVVQAGEIPAAWGAYEVTTGGKVALLKPAPRLDAEPPSKEFLCSVLRNQAGMLASAQQRGHDAAFREAEASVDRSAIDAARATAEAIELERRKLEQSVFELQRQVGDLRGAISGFEKASGVKLDASDLRCFGRPEALGRAFRAACALGDFDTEQIAARFDAAAAALRAAVPWSGA